MLTGPVILAAGVIIGLLIPVASDLAKPFLSISVFVFVVGSFVRLNVGIFKETITQPLISLGLPTIGLIVIPIMLWVGSLFIGLSYTLALGILMYASSPPSTGNAAIARMFGYKGEVPMTVIVASTILCPFTISMLIATLTNEAIGWLPLAVSLVSFLGGAVVVAIVLRWLLYQLPFGRSELWLDRVILAALFVFALATMAGVQSKLLADPWLGLFVVALAYIVNVSMQLIGVISFRGALDKRIAVGLTMGNRNIGLLWAVTGASLVPETILFFAATQLPIFTLPFFLRIFFDRYL